MSTKALIPIPVSRLIIYSLAVVGVEALVVGTAPTGAPDVHWARVATALTATLLVFSTVETLINSKRFPDIMTSRRTKFRHGRNAVCWLVVFAGFAWSGDTVFACLHSGLLVVMSAEALMTVHRSLSARLAEKRAIRITTSVLFVLLVAPIWVSVLIVVMQFQFTILLARMAPIVNDIGLNPAKEREVWLESADGTPIYGVLLEGEPDGPAFVICHGLGDSQVGMADLAWLLGGIGGHSLRIDMRAHGRSGGATSTILAMESHDIEAARRFLESEPQTQGRPIFLVGMSAGAGALLANAARDNGSIRGVIAIAPVLDVEGLSRHRLGVAGPLRGWITTLTGHACHALTGFRVGDYAPIEGFREAGALPVLIFHARGDQVIPLAHSKAFQERYPWVELVEFDGTHNDLDYVAFQEPLGRFVDTHSK